MCWLCTLALHFVLDVLLGEEREDHRDGQDRRQVPLRQRRGFVADSLETARKQIK